jgi:hypothetical protein
MPIKDFYVSIAGRNLRTIWRNRTGLWRRRQAGQALRRKRPSAFEA